MLKITKETCDAACELLNKAKSEGDDTWIQPLMKKTDEMQEGVGALTHFIMCNMPAFTEMAMVMAPSFAEEKRMPMPMAIVHLQTQLIARLMLYVANRAHENQQFENIMDFTAEAEESPNDPDQKSEE